MQEQLDKRGDGIGQDTDAVAYFLLKKVCNPSPAMIKQTTKKIDCGQNAVASSNIRTRRLFHNYSEQARQGTTVVPGLSLRFDLLSASSSAGAGARREAWRGGVEES